MFRCCHRPIAAVLAAGAALFSVPQALAATGRASVESSSAKGKGKPQRAPKKDSQKPEQAGSSERKAPAENKSGTEEKASAAKKTGDAKRPARPAGANRAKRVEKGAPAGKAASSSNRAPALPVRPVAAKSAVVPREDERTRRLEPALKPPGAARPMVRAASGSRLVVPPPEVAEQSLAFHYANLGDAEAIDELNRRGIAWVPASPPLPGVRTPIRLSGPLRGVTIHSTLPEPERRTSAFEILDARLALALDDFCALLARHDVVELVHYTMYRPPGELPPDLTKQIRHPAGLAIDVGAVRKADGRWLAIGPHWPSDIGAKTCGEGARELWSRPGREIVSIACEAADLRMFHFILTPHFDAAHADHLHLEIKPETRWFLVN
jgi:hypothetical protein